MSTRNMNFKLYIENIQNIDANPIIQKYDKAKISVDLVKKYRPDLLEDISVIANLASGAYGVYTHFGVNKTYLTKNTNLKQVPQSMLLKAYPDIDPSKLNTGDVIRVNVNKIINDPNVHSDLEAVLQISSTIIHEATHKKEIKETGHTSEAGPMQAEKQFMDLMKAPDKQKEIIDALMKYPQTDRKVKNKLY